MEFLRKRLTQHSVLTGLLVMVAGQAFSATVPTIISSATVRVIRVRYQATGACLGFDATVTPVAIMAPVGGTNDAQATINPTSQATRVRFDSGNTGVATVSPVAATGSPETLHIGGIARGNTLIHARTPTSGVLHDLEADSKPPITRKIAIHAITELNDDVQTTPVGQGEANQTCITAGPNGVIDSTVAGDDVLVGTTSIHTGPNGICNTSKSGDDVQVIPVGQGLPNRPCVGQGANSFRDSIPVGDDQVSGADIDSGANGVCETPANATNVVPNSSVVPTAAALQAYLNMIWGQQANVSFTVTRTDPPPINYDFDRSGTLAHPSRGTHPDPAEGNAISAAAADGSADYNIYFVLARDYSIGTTAGAETWTAANGDNSPLNHIAHEVGHLLGLYYESNDPIDVMLSFGSAANPCNVKKIDWDGVNH